MGKGGKQDCHTSEQLLTWKEVKKHAARDDKWIVIDKEVYDITRWAKKHPGGSRIISHYAGQDASEAFRAFHNDANYVRKFLGAIHIGKINPEEQQNSTEEEMRKDFEKLRETVTKMGLFRPSITFFVAMFAQILLCEVLAYCSIYIYGSGWLPFLSALLFLTISQAQAGWTHHDFGHLSVFNSRRLNHAMHFFLLSFLKGASSTWWNHLHYQHHAKPNVIDKDPDVRLEAVFVVGDEMPKTVAKNKKNSMPYNHQHKYFFIIGPPLLFPVYFQYMIFHYVITRKQWMDFFIMCLYYIKYFLLYVPLLGWPSALALYFSMRVLESHWFVWVAQSNHIPMEIASDQARPWLPLQLSATCDVTKTAFNDWFTGHLNFQIEHHLFPMMPRHNLYKAQPFVKSLCEKHNIPFVVKPLSTAFADIIRALKHSGEIWNAYYHAYHFS